MRAAYQAAIWRRCFQPKPIDMDHGPNGHGWKVEGGDTYIYCLDASATCS